MRNVFESHMYGDTVLYLRQLPIVTPAVVIIGGPQGIGSVIKRYRTEAEVRGHELSPTDKYILFVKYVCCVKPIIADNYYIYAASRETELKIHFGYVSIEYRLVGREGDVRKYKGKVTTDEKVKKIVLKPLHPRLIERLANEELYRHNFWIKAPNELIIELNGGSRIHAVFNDGGIEVSTMGQLPLTWFSQKGQILKKLGLT